MSARIARGSSSRGKPRLAAGNRARASRKPQSSPLLEGLPVPPGTVKKIFAWLFFALFTLVALAVATAFGVPQAIGTSIGNAIGDAGFRVRRIEPRGVERPDRLAEVYEIILDRRKMPMPLVDLDGTREKLLSLSWIEEARVSRRFPDTLAVEIIERKPAAIWQQNQRLSIIDRSGTIIEEVRLDKMPDLPLLIGRDANRRAAEVSDLIETAPQLKPILASATWVGGRRWDLRFQSGELLSLPEGEAEARKAISIFAKMDASTHLLGRGFVRFDMRIPGKLIVRISNEPGSVVPEIDTPPPPSAGGPIDPTNTI